MMAPHFSNRTFRLAALSCSLLLGFDGHVYAADLSVVPVAFSSDRYESLLGKSPFAVASLPPEPVAPTENFATNWVVTGLAKNRTPEGTISYTAFIRSRDLSTRIVLMGDKPNADGVSIESVTEAPIAAKSVVMVKKGTDVAKVEFDQAAISAGPAPVNAAPNANKPAAGTPAKPAATRTPIPRPGMSVQPRAATPPSGTAAPAPARRVRTVEDAPPPAQ